MLSFLPGIIVGVIALAIYIFFIIVLGSLFFIFLLIWLITPIPAWRRKLQNFIFNIPSIWSDTIRFTIWLTTKTQWEIHGLENLNKQQSYLLISNHQGFLDILILQKVLDKHVPQLRYFMKHELLWVPILGLACLILGYPFMHRYKKNYLKQHPEKSRVDIETTRKACERFKNTPVTLINYVEGTRFTAAKQARTFSPFQYLLKPKAGGIALILSAMQQQITTILNVTVVYSQRKPATWNFLQGKMRKVVVNIEQIPIPPDLRGDYEHDRQFRVHFQKWLNTIWQKKDQLIAETIKKL